jgi:DNA-binding NtrC family response regulator
MPSITPAAIDALKAAAWPDNIRGLRNAIRRSLVRIARGTTLDADDLILSKDSILGQTAGSTISVNESDIGALLGLAPRAGSQRNVFDRLVDKIPEAVPNEDLNEAIGQPRTADATQQLMVAISRLRSRLQQHGFSIRQERDQKSYGLVRIADHA